MIDTIDKHQITEDMKDKNFHNQDELICKYPGRKVCAQNGEVVVFVPLKFKTRNGKRQILTPSGKEQKMFQHAPLIEAIAKAWKWQEMLESGQYPDLQTLANALGPDRTYISRIIKLTSLAPDIVQAIFSGNEPDNMSLAELHKGISMSWEQQRKQWPVIIVNRIHR